jgi:hypothetical protein
MKYYATFKGRRVGAIGIFYNHSKVCEGRNEKEAILDLYKTHEHISNLKLTPIVRLSWAKPGDRFIPLNENGRGLTGEIYTVESRGTSDFVSCRSSGDVLTWLESSTEGIIL